MIRTGNLPVTIHDTDGQLFVNVNPDDILDLNTQDLGKVTVTIGGDPLPDPPSGSARDGNERGRLA